MKEVKLYPQLEKDNATPVNTFRLAHIVEEIKFLERELTVYSKCRRRYGSVYNALFYINSTSTVISVGCTITSLGLFGSGVGSLFALPLLGAGLGSEAISLGLSLASKKIMVKVKKHEAIAALASGKLSSVKLIVSKALEDGQISDLEFHKVQSDIEDYKTQKRQIQNKILDGQVVDVEKIKQDFLEEGKKLGIQETFAKLTDAVKVNTNKSPEQ